jgi:DNA repair exonuclease SbcCD nuclease subunit
LAIQENDDLFKELIKEKAKFMITHREIPELIMDYEACFFGHIHKHYQQGNCYSIGSLFKITWAEENEKNYYLLFDDKEFKFIENKDLNIKTYRITDKNYPEIPEDVDFARFEIIDSIEYITSLKEEEISKNYKNKIFFKYTPTEAAIDFKEIEDPKEAVAKLLKDKNLTQEQLNFGMKFL